MKASNGLVSEEQFFKEFRPLSSVRTSFFPNGEYSAGVNILQDVDGTIQKLRDEVVCVSIVVFRRSRRSTT